MIVRFLSIAEQEYQDSYDYYESIVIGLVRNSGKSFSLPLNALNDFPMLGKMYPNGLVGVGSIDFPMA